METYTVLALSTAHLAEGDRTALSDIIHNEGSNMHNMVMERNTGYFIKLYENCNYNRGANFSPALKKIIKFAHSEGHRMIELDSDGPEYPELFEIFDW